MDAYSDATHDPSVAALRAVQEHGAVDDIASAYAPDLAVAWTRCTGLLALAITPAIAIIWNVALRLGPPSSWHPSGPGLHIAETVIAGGICLTFLCSTAALLGTGRLARAIGDHLPAFRFAVCTASAALTIAVLAMLGVVTARALTAPGSLQWPAVLTALAMTLTALTRVGQTAYHCSTSFHTKP